MAFSNRNPEPDSGAVSGGNTAVLVMLALIGLMAFLLLVAGCGGDNDDNSPSRSASPTSSAADASPTRNDGNGSTPAPTDNGNQSTAPAGTGTGTATIDGVQYDFAVNSCGLSADTVLIIGTGVAPDGKPFFATVTWYAMDIFGQTNSLELGIITNVLGLLEDPDEAFKAGQSDQSTTLDSLDLDLAGFSVEAAGDFYNQKAQGVPPVKGTFSLSCR